MDTGKGYSQDIEYKISICKALSGDIEIRAYCKNDGKSFIHAFSPGCDIGRGLVDVSNTLKRHYNNEMKSRFLEWVATPEPVT